MNQLQIDREKCRMDGICVAVCPMRIIAMKDSSSLPALVSGTEELCIKCGHCVAVCPHGALALDDMKTEDCPPLRAELAIDSDQAEQLIRSRRSIRVYSKKPVEREKLARLIDLAHYAPTATNSQQVQWLVINSQQLHSLAGMIIDMVRYLIKEGHPLAKAYRLERSVAAWEAGLDPVLRGAPALVIAHAPKGYAMGQVDSTIALTSLELAAPTVGLGCCWAGFFMMAAGQWPPLQEALALPEGQVCCGALMIGYPHYSYHRLPLRKPAVISWRG